MSFLIYVNNKNNNNNNNKTKNKTRDFKPSSFFCMYKQIHITASVILMTLNRLPSSLCINRYILQLQSREYDVDVLTTTREHIEDDSYCVVVTDGNVVSHGCM